MVDGRRPREKRNTAPLAAATQAPTEAASETGATDYEALTVAELQALCDERGLPRSGTKAELVERLNG